MLKKHTFWLKAAIILQLLTAGLHSLSFLNNPLPENESEKQLMDLMNTYKKDLGGGFDPSMNDILISLSACLPLLCILGGWINLYLLKKKADENILKGVVGINVIVFGACFILMAIFTFLPPIICTGLIFIFLLLSWLTFPKQKPV
ncbi:MAG TPA: hypothetical protein VJY62_10580 [Bacteroidia bacterium]|nr:hypothetical protein [Bacteroidia bacterium]